jgi:hypothetical protein
MEKVSNNRWWEFYGIRYAMGTIVGAVIVLFLFRSNPSLCHLLFLPEEAKDLNGAHLALLAIYGLTYCYLASGPILVFYLSRAYLKVEATGWSFFRAYRFWTLVIVLMVGFAVGYYWWCPRRASDALWQEGVGVVFALLIIAQLVVILFSVSSKRGKLLADYCMRVSLRRVIGKNEGFVETYRHMREHGNSYMIVFFELVLGIVFFAFVNSGEVIGVPPDSYIVVGRLVTIVIMWVFPTMLVWIVGLRLENYMVSNQ